MNTKSLLSILLTLVLTACGGGGGGSAPSPTVTAATNTFTCVTHGLVPADKYRSVNIDLRRDHSGVNSNGDLVNSFNAVKLMIDRANCVGFDTVTLQTNIPIDKVTGKLVLIDPAATMGDTDMTAPKDFWRIADYAKSIGLKVAVRAIPIDYTNDEVLSDYYYKQQPIPASEILNSIATYGKMMAANAQAHHVDLFYVGVSQMGFDGASYNTEWQHIVDEIKSVYTGKLAYQSCYQCDNVVWSKVDYIAMNFSPLLSNVPEYSVVQLVTLYSVNQAVQLVQTTSTKYHKPVILDSLNIDAASTTVGDSTSWQLLASGTANTAVVDYKLQAARFAAVFELSATSLNGYVGGITFGEYDPWLQSTWIQTNPTSQWKLFDTLGFSLYNNESAQNALKQYLGQAWNYHVLVN